VNEALVSLDAEFDRLYSAEGRPSIASKRLLRASLVQMLFSVRSAGVLQQPVNAGVALAVEVARVRQIVPRRQPRLC
jgi:transposase